MPVPHVCAVMVAQQIAMSVDCDSDVFCRSLKSAAFDVAMYTKNNNKMENFVFRPNNAYRGYAGRYIRKLNGGFVS